MRAALALVLLVAACGGDDDGGNTGPADANTIDVPGDAMPREVVTENVPLVVNEIVEAIMVGGPGDYARITASADGAPIDWNIHGHANGETQVVSEGFKVPNVDYLFIPSAQADWYLLLRNKGQTDITIKLKVELYNSITWSGWQ